MEARGTDLPGPVTQIPDCMIRPDGSQPIAAEYWDQLPTTVVRRARGDKPAQGQLTKEAFLYDAELDCCWCPVGQKLKYSGTSHEPNRRQGKTCTIERKRYAAPAAACFACALKSRCLRNQDSKNGRVLTIDEFEPQREQLRERMTITLFLNHILRPQPVRKLRCPECLTDRVIRQVQYVHVSYSR